MEKLKAEPDRAVRQGDLCPQGSSHATRECPQTRLLLDSEVSSSDLIREFW